MIGAMFAGSLALAAFIAAERGFFEKFVEEKYTALPASLKPLADAAAENRIDKEAFARLSREERLILYDDWMARAETLERTPASLVQADAALYLARAERSIVAGRAEQKMRAVKFLELAGSRDALPILRKARAWSVRRGETNLTAKIDETLRLLERTSSEVQLPSTSSTEE